MRNKLPNDLPGSPRSRFGYHASLLSFPGKFLITRAISLLLVMACIFGSSALARQGSSHEQYIQVITERSAKIVNTLSITDSLQYHLVLALMVNQYAQINEIQDQGKILADDIRLKNKDSALAVLLQREYSRRKDTLLALHEKFVASLKQNITAAQLELVKDGMTYRILPVTYAAYQNMILTLTAEQKEKIYNWLLEARELAMDEGSSEKKHAVFGRYKGRINNYLSAAGFDMKKEGEEWQKRIKATGGSK